MKTTQNFLKTLFGDHKLGLAYLKSLHQKQKTPVLFVYGAKANEFAEWIAQFSGGGAATTDKPGFNASQGKVNESLVLVKNLIDLDDNTLTSSNNARKIGKNVVVLTQKAPSLLDMINDPNAFRVMRIDNFDAKLINEVPEVKSLLG